MSLNSLVCYTIREIPKTTTEATNENYDWIDLLAGDSLELWRNSSNISWNKRPTVGELSTIKDGVVLLDKSKEGPGGHLITKAHETSSNLKDS